MTDDATGVEPQVISAHFSDPYVLLIRDDQGLMVLRVEENGDLDEVEQGAGVLENKFISGSLYEDSNDVLRLEESSGSDDSDDDVGNVLLFLLSNGGGLAVSFVACWASSAGLNTGFLAMAKHKLICAARYIVYQISQSLSTSLMALAFFHRFYPPNLQFAVRLRERSWSRLWLLSLEMRFTNPRSSLYADLLSTIFIGLPV